MAMFVVFWFICLFFRGKYEAKRTRLPAASPELYKNGGQSTWEVTPVHLCFEAEGSWKTAPQTTNVEETV